MSPVNSLITGGTPPAAQQSTAATPTEQTRLGDVGETPIKKRRLDTTHTQPMAAATQRTATDFLIPAIQRNVNNGQAASKNGDHKCAAAFLTHAEYALVTLKESKTATKEQINDGARLVDGLVNELRNVPASAPPAL